MHQRHRHELDAVLALGACVALPALLRAVAVVPAPVAHALVLAGFGTVALAGSGASRARARRWSRDAMVVVASIILLSTLWAVRHPWGAPAASMVTALALLCLGAVTEELVYRGWLPEMIDRTTSHTAAPALLSTFAFALAHPVGSGVGTGVAAINPFVAHTLAGGAFYALRGSDGSLVAPMLAHVAYNAAVRLAMP